MPSFLDRFKTIDFYRSEVVKKNNGYKPTRHESTVDLLNLTSKSREDLSSFQSNYDGKLLWGVPLRQEVKTGLDGHYSIKVAAGRFLARYALDSTFRNDFLKDPSSFAIANSHSRVNPNDAFVFTEGSDKKLYPLKGNKHKLEEGHLIAQRISPETETTQLIHPREVFKLLRVLAQTHPDFSYRNIGDILLTAGYEGEDLRKAEDECVIKQSDEEGRSYHPLIDSLNAAVLKAEEKIQEGDSNISREQLIDIAARSITSYLSVTRFDPELISPSQYESELKKVEKEIPRVEPDLEITGAQNLERIKPINQSTEGNIGPSGENLG